jgi:hypothetical protein
VLYVQANGGLSLWEGRHNYTGCARAETATADRTAYDRWSVRKAEKIMCVHVRLHHL